MQFPQDQAVFALVNEIDRKVYVSYSARLHQRLGTITSEILAGDWKYKDMIQDKNKLECVILEQSDTKLFVKYFIDQYKKLGYDIYNEREKTPLEYKFKLEFTYRNIVVCAVNKRNEKIVLGEFDTHDEAEKFLAYVSTNNPAKSLVYKIAGNPRTDK